ncbi:MAG: YceD family protein [Actinomycetia bacterium]|nr:YceD family protein [Actinomycetes bacterium]
MDTRDLGRRPGSMRQLTRTVPAPADLGTGVIGVPAGSDVHLDIRCESVVEGVLVTATARVRVEGECVRCLDPVASSAEVAVQELYYYPDQDVDDEEAERLEGDLLDLEPALRDSVVLALPLQPLCRDDCPGLCPSCGVRLADDPGHRHDVADPRWAALGALRPEHDPLHDPTDDEMEGG